MAPEAAPPRPNFGRTLLGQGPPVPTRPGEQPATATPVPLDRKATMIGISPPLPVPPGEAKAAGSAPAPPQPARDSSAPPPTPPGFGRTVLGLGDAVQPVLRQMSTLVMEPAKPTQRGPEPAAGGASPPSAKTILGVARPGIAPLNPGVAKPVAPQPEFVAPPPPPALSSPTTVDDEPEVPVKRSAPLFAGIAIGAAVLLLGAAAGAFFWFRGPGPIEAKAALSSDGKERLLLTCAGCNDGTVLRLGEQQATVRGGHAELALAAPLKVGENRFELAVAPAGNGRVHQVSLNVPLEYRVKGDTSTLGETPPRLSVQIEAVPGSKLSVEDQPLTLAANGHATYAVDVSKELSGSETTVKRVDRRVPYVITPPQGAAQRGEVLFQLGVIPLTLDAPGESITIEGSTFVLAGRTLKGSAVDVAGRAIPVDAEGRFEQTMAVSAAGETSVAVRASAPDYAPRIVSFRVRRVSSLAEHARSERARSITAYSTVASNIEQQRGKQVAFDGSVIEIGATAPSTLFLLDTKSGCPKAPCISKVVYGGRLKLAVGERVSVFGSVRSAVEGPKAGTRVPEVAADFVVKAAR